MLIASSGHGGSAAQIFVTDDPGGTSRHISVSHSEPSLHRSPSSFLQPVTRGNSASRSTKVLMWGKTYRIPRMSASARASRALPTLAKVVSERKRASAEQEPAGG